MHTQYYFVEHTFKGSKGGQAPNQTTDAGVTLGTNVLLLPSLIFRGMGTNRPWAKLPGFKTWLTHFLAYVNVTKLLDFSVFHFNYV